jgi:hypothetical protein
MAKLTNLNVQAEDIGPKVNMQRIKKNEKKYFSHTAGELYLSGTVEYST